MPEQIPFITFEAPKSPDGRIQLLPPHAVEAFMIEEVKGAVIGTSFRDLGLIPELSARLKDIVGGSEKKIERGYEKAYADAVAAMREDAERLEATTVIDFKVTDEMITDPDTGNLIIKAVATGLGVNLKDVPLTIPFDS